MNIEKNTKVRTIYMSTNEKGWVAISGPIFLEYKRGEWLIFKDFKKEKGKIIAPYMNDIDFSERNDGWAVGHNLTPSEGFVFHYDGVDWEEVTPYPMRPLYCVAAVAPDDVWAAGWYGTMYHYDGSSWAQVPFPASPEICALHFPAPNDGWAVGYSGSYFHYDGSAWEPARVNDAEVRYGVFFPTPDEGWAVGGGGVIPEYPAQYPIFHYENGEWKKTFRAQMRFESVHFAAPDDGWAAGSHVLRYDGKEWHVITPPGKLYVYDIFTLGGDDVWLACYPGTICKYNPNKK